MEQYKILGIDENASMEEVKRAYEDKVNKFKNEIKDERRARAFIKVFDKAYQDIKTERESSQSQQTMVIDIKDIDLTQYYKDNTNIDSLNEDDDSEDESWDDDEYDDFDEDDDDEFIISKVKRKVSSKRNAKKKQKNNEKKSFKNKDRNIDKNVDKDGKDINKRAKTVVIKEKKKTSVITTLIQLPLKILALPIIAGLSIIIFLCKVISLISWIAAKAIIIASISVCAIHGYQVYTGHAVQYKIFILSGVAFVVSLFLPSILRIIPSMLGGINNSLKRFVFM